ncbi:MAG: hypothetical protein ABL973_09350 [Micropepsaceae bacterium]
MRDLMVGLTHKEITNGAGQGSLGGTRPRPAPIDALPKWLLCVPLVAHWLWLALIYRSATLPSALNPGIETGGLAGESKFSYLEPIDRRFGEWVADTFQVQPGADAVAIRLQAGLTFPLIAKPDIGWCGYGVRRIESDDGLRDYSRAFPSDATFLLQRFAHEKNEAGILYIREAGATDGHVTALTVRHAPHVEGDGIRSIGDLIAADGRMQHKSSLYLDQLGCGGAARVPAAGERIELTTVASVRVGGRYENLSVHITPALEAAVDAIAKSVGGFHYGRFDVKFESLAALKAGRFTIIEINGAGSEAIQNWDPRLSLFEAFSGIFAKQRLLFALAHRMRERGYKPVGWRALAAAYIRQQRLVRRYPASN